MIDDWEEGRIANSDKQMANLLHQKTLGLFVKTGGVLSRPLLGGLGHIFMLHRVLPVPLREQWAINRSLAITPEFLERTVRWFREKDYRFVSLDEVHDILLSGRRPRQRFVCLTLDDGYRDNLEYGLPLFQRLEVPVTIYVTNGFPNGTAIPWWYLLEEAVAQAGALTLGERQFRWERAAQGKAMYRDIRAAIRQLPRTGHRQALLTAFGKTDGEATALCRQLALSWDEVKQLSQEPLVTIGAHTMNHLSLSALTDEELRAEVLESKAELERHTGQEVRHFAYPFGGTADAHHREYAMVARMDFRTATLNVPGNIFAQQRGHMECLPRMGLSDSTTQERLDHICNGIFHFSHHGFKRTFAP